MMLTRGHSCVLCQQRKVRCDQEKPCSNCVKARAECRVAPPAPRRRRARKLQGYELIERLQRYETLMSQHGIDFNHVQGAEDASAALRRDINSSKSPCAGEGLPGNGAGAESRRESPGSFAYSQEYRNIENIMQESSRNDLDRPTIHQSFDVMFDNVDGFPLVTNSVPTSVTSVHPPTVKIFQLWQIYINNVDPLIKIIHVPTFQTQIVGASADPSKIPKPLEALMFGIYSISVVSLADDEAQNMFDEGKAVLLAKYRRSTQQALANADFMRSSDLMVLQAYLLYLFSVRSYMDPRSLFCLTGIAVRIATRMGLHRDGSHGGLSPFETEQRRRLWWQITILDKRIAEMTGSATTTLSSPGTDCSLPLNINDTGLHPHAKAPPTAHTGATEATFSLTRIELTVGLTPSGSRRSPDPRAADPKRPHDLEGYCAYMESLYLRHCDPNIPVHLFTLLMTRMSLCRLRVVGFMSRGNPTTDLDETERDRLFTAAIQMLDYTTEICTTKDLSGFHWYMYMHIPMPGCLFLASELRRRTTGELCERAWKALRDYYNNPGIGCNVQSPVHSAISNMLLSAWDGHEEAERRQGRAAQPPELVILLRQRSRRKSAGYPRTEKTPTVESGGIEASQGPWRQPRESVDAGPGTLSDEQPDGLWVGLPDYTGMDWPQLLQYGMFEGLDTESWVGFTSEGNGSL
ncbi:fungal-specific transcription factor domain-containing protein [Aspergillus ambiguus]|uniref:transcription factor domain-containing protein n=1 Tax=Aspergillus ambiguus TaxID=176160 RepID=UPI003CCD7790